MRKTIYITMFVVLGIMMAIISNILTSPLNINQKIIDINEGQSARSIAKVLYKEGVIRSDSAFYILVRLTNNDKKLKQGAYLFNGINRNNFYLTIKKRCRSIRCLKKYVLFLLCYLPLLFLFTQKTPEQKLK